DVGINRADPRHPRGLAVLPHLPAVPNVATAADAPGSAALRTLPVVVGDPGMPLGHAAVEPAGVAGAHIDHRLDRHAFRLGIGHNVPAPLVDPVGHPAGARRAQHLH